MQSMEPGRCLLLDWGDTVMRVLPGYRGSMAHWPRVEAVEGVSDALTRLRGEWTIALATNAADSREDEIRSALQRAGLESFFDRIFCYRAIGHRKSEPEYFERVLAELEIAPGDAVMVGDDLEADVLAANRSGIRAIWYCADGSEERTDAMYRTIHSLRELPDALKLLV